MRPIAAPSPSRPPSWREPAPRARESLFQLVTDLVRRSWSRVDSTHYLDDYLASEWLPTEALADLQRAKLRRLVWHCFLNVPWYRARIGAAVAPSEIERLDGLAALPIATAEDRRDARAFVAATEQPVGELRRTHGTRGARQPVVVDVESLDRQLAVRLRSEAWAGARPQKIVAAWGRDALREARALDRAELAALVVALERARGAVVSGPGPSLGALAEYMNSHGAGIRGAVQSRARGAASWLFAQLAGPSPVAAVIARGEDPGGGGARLAETLGAPLRRWYGAAEVGVIAASCDRSGDALHVHADHLIVEVVDGAGRPVPDGAAGRVLITDLHNHAAPYLRHELGDRARFTGRACACGRALPLVELLGRQ